MEINITTTNFKNEIIDSKIPALVDFWAPWCGPCQKITPHLEEIAKDYNGKIKVCKLNVDEAPEIATEYTIMSIPAIMLFKSGKVMSKRVGVMSKQDLEKFIQPYI
ncbi:MAG: thioredoxin [Candidatus Susulua stagnicola]|nr:thioredoxin [Candidatus Susulua stagnicola]